MMIQIRNNVFETNSSSSHSLIVKNESGKYTTEEIEKDMYVYNGQWNIREADFGRSPFDILDTFESKWRYAMASMCIEYKDEVYEELVEILRTYCPQITKINLDKCNQIRRMKSDDYPDGLSEEEMEEFVSNLENKFDMNVDFWDDGYGFWVYETPNVGYVDQNILSGFLKRNNISLEDFITERKYAVIVDGDEYCIWDKLKESGLVDKEKILKEHK